MNRQNDIPLIDRVISKHHMGRRIEKGRKNKGVSGVNGMTVDELEEHMQTYRAAIVRKLKNDTYQTQSIKRVEIPKRNDGVRLLEILTVRDRIVQQAILQLIDPINDPKFSECS